MIKRSEIKVGMRVKAYDPDFEGEQILLFTGTVESIEDLGTGGDYSYTAKLRIDGHCWHNSKYLQTLSPDKTLNCFGDDLYVLCPINTNLINMPVNSPFDIFNNHNDQWTWLAEHCNPYEYTELDNIFCVLDGTIEQDELSEHLQKLSIDELKAEYVQRFPKMFAKALKAIADTILSGETQLEIDFTE